MTVPAPGGGCSTAGPHGPCAHIHLSSQAQCARYKEGSALHNRIPHGIRSCTAILLMQPETYIDAPSEMPGGTRCLILLLPVPTDQCTGEPPPSYGHKTNGIASPVHSARYGCTHG